MNRRARMVAGLALATLVAAPGALASTVDIPAESITTLYQDRAGFLWIGSREGLILYDGYTSTLYEHDPADPTSLSDNVIRAIFEDREGRLWIGTNTHGVDRLDRATGVFAHFPHDSNDPRSLSHDCAFAIVQDGDGKLWVGTQAGLDRMDPATGSVERFPAGGDRGPGADFIVGLLVDSKGALWVGTSGGGLSRRDPKTGLFKTYRHDPASVRSLNDDQVFSIAEDAKGRLWLATWLGVCRLDPATGEVTRIPFRGLGKDGNPAATFVIVGPDQAVWAAAYSEGVWRAAPGEDELVRQRFRPGDPKDEPSRIVWLLCDRDGAIWIGTWGGGLGRISPRAVSADPRGERLDVESILEWGDGSLWLGDYDGYLHHVRRDGSVRSYSGVTIPLEMVDDGAGRIWVGAVSGLMRLDPATGALEDESRRGDAEGSLGPGWIRAVHRDRHGRLWVGTGEAGLHLRRDDGSFERFTHVADDPHSLSDNYILAILEDRAGTLWVGTRSGGLDAFDTTKKTFTRYLPVAGDPHSLGHHTVTALLEDRRGALWVGTGGGGLHLAERTGPGGEVRFTRFTEDDGLIDDNVVSLLEDDDGTLWIGTRRGLSRFDPRSRRFVNFGIEDGLPSAEFAQGARSIGRSTLYFGTHRGLVTIPRGTRFVVPGPSPTRITQIRTPKGAWRGDRPPWETASVQAAYGETLSFEFATLDFGERRRHRYAYRLDGVHDDWIDLGTHREITLTALSPGSYTLRVRGRNDQGVWSESAVPLRLRIVPPFWMTGWFKLLVAAAVAAMAVGGHLYRTATLERRNRELALLKDQRERALDEARSSQEALHSAYERLRGLTRRLEAAKEEERKRIARELHDEMGQILTTAKLNLQLLSRPFAPEDRDRRIADTIELLDRMIGQVRALSLDLRPPLLDELGLDAAVRGYLEAQAKRSGLEIAVDHDGAVPLSPDVEIAAFRVVQEAVTNVLRHASARRISVRMRREPAELAIEVRDDGVGFDPAAVLDRGASLQRIGLPGMRERVSSMGGSMTIDSSPGAGSTVRARLPIES